MQEIIARKVASGLLFGEGIRWTGRAIVLSDMLGKRVVQVDPLAGTVTTLVEIENQPNGLIVRADGSLRSNIELMIKLPSARTMRPFGWFSISTNVVTVPASGST